MAAGQLPPAPSTAPGPLLDVHLQVVDDVAPAGGALQQRVERDRRRAALAVRDDGVVTGIAGGRDPGWRSSWAVTAAPARVVRERPQVALGEHDARGVHLDGDDACADG